MRPLHKYSLAAILVVAAVIAAILLSSHPQKAAEVAVVDQTTPPQATTTVATQTPDDAPTAGQDPKVQILKDVLKSGNDNDLRLDSDFKNMTPELKHQLEKLYAQYEREKFNERGTIVFLIGRDLKTVDDAQFLFSVLHEPPCKGLAVCGRADQGGEERPGSEVTRAYPQANAFRALVKAQSIVKALGLERQFTDLRDTLKSSDSDVLARLANQDAP